MKSRLFFFLFFRITSVKFIVILNTIHGITQRDKLDSHGRHVMDIMSVFRSSVLQTILLSSSHVLFCNENSRMLLETTVKILTPSMSIHSVARCIILVLFCSTLQETKTEIPSTQTGCSQQSLEESSESLLSHGIHTFP